MSVNTWALTHVCMYMGYITPFDNHRASVSLCPLIADASEHDEVT